MLKAIIICNTIVCTYYFMFHRVDVTSSMIDLELARLRTAAAINAMEEAVADIDSCVGSDNVEGDENGESG